MESGPIESKNSMSRDIKKYDEINSMKSLEKNMRKAFA